jgi:nucleotide-binding universal stress UspA family protein
VSRGGRLASPAAKALHIAGPEDAMIRFGHILVPVDFELSSKRALEVAIDLALKFDAKLTLFHAWDTPAYAYANFYVSGDLWSALEEAAKKQLGETLAEVRKRAPHADSVLVCGPAGFEILKAIERENPDLVVIGTHGREDLSRILLGSVAEKVVRGSSVPVLTIGAGVASLDGP